MAIQTVSAVGTDFLQQSIEETAKAKDNSFSSIFESALDMVQQTNELQNAAQAEEIKWALGYTDNTHSYMAALTKAEMAIQYTVAVKNKVLEAYKEIMNIQI